MRARPLTAPVKVSRYTCAVSKSIRMPAGPRWSRSQIQSPSVFNANSLVLHADDRPFLDVEAVTL
jgi:hypothetical protein